MKTGSNEGLSAFSAEWYSSALNRMEEPKLPKMAREENQCVFRLLILPTWGNPIAIRVQKDAQSYVLFSRRLDGEGGYDPGKLAEQAVIKLSATDSQTLESLLAAMRFFEMTTEDNISGADGEQWVLEGVFNRRYHVVERWSASITDPEERKRMPFLNFCRFLIDNSGLSVRPRNANYELLPIKKVAE